MTLFQSRLQTADRDDFERSQSTLKVEILQFHDYSFVLYYCS